MKESTHLQVKGYPGLDGTAEFIMPLIPSSKVYVEVFAGMGRTVEVDKHEEIILNDMSDYAFDYLTKRFNATVTQIDFEKCIKNNFGTIIRSADTMRAYLDVTNFNTPGISTSFKDFMLPYEGLFLLHHILLPQLFQLE